MASHSTRDHDEIQRWAEKHQAAPSVVSRTGGMLRFEFTDAAGGLEAAEWEDFFRVFDEKGLELIYDDKPGSRFHKFAYPETVAAKSDRGPKAKPAATAGARGTAPAGGTASGRRAGRTGAGKAAAQGRRAATPIAKGRGQTGAGKPAAKLRGRGRGDKAA